VLVLQVLPPPQSESEQHAEVLMHAPLHSFVEPEQMHWLLLLQVLPPVQSLFEQHPELAMQEVPQFFGREVGHEHWLL
jgi:hypothetical protein